MSRIGHTPISPKYTKNQPPQKTNWLPLLANEKSPPKRASFSRFFKPDLDDTLCQHCISNFHEAGNVCTGNVADGAIWTGTILDALVVEALPGAYRIPRDSKSLAASMVEGMFAPSATQITPFSIRVLASFSSSSFWVAQGNATSTGTNHGRDSG